MIKWPQSFQFEIASEWISSKVCAQITTVKVQEKYLILYV